MTREEAIQVLNMVEAHGSLVIQAKEMAIKALERERERERKSKTDMLDKIRVEIAQTADEEQKHDEKWAKGLRYALKIIDKYRQEEI